MPCLRSDLSSKKLAAALECLHDIRTTCPSPMLVEVWCDGSVSSEGEGGSGFVIIKRTTDDHGEEVASGNFASGIFATFSAESRAALEGLTRADRSLRRQNPWSNSLLSATVGRWWMLDPYRMAPDVVPLYEALCHVAEQTHTVHLVWVSSNHGLVMNDEADSLLAIGTSLPQTSPLSVQAVKAAVRHSTQYPPPHTHTHTHTAPLLDVKTLGSEVRRNTTTLNQLLTGHCSLLGKYLHQIQAVDSPDCTECPGIPEDVNHLLLQCPHRHNNRITINKTKYGYCF